MICSSDFRAKITDFGLVQIFEVMKSTMLPAADAVWSPPESMVLLLVVNVAAEFHIQQSRSISAAVDVFSFGVLLWTLVTQVNTMLFIQAVTLDRWNRGALCPKLR